MLRKKARVQFHLSHIKPASKSKPNTTSQPTIRYSAIEPSLSTHLNPFKSTKRKIQLNPFLNPIKALTRNPSKLHHRTTPTKPIEALNQCHNSLIYQPINCYKSLVVIINGIDVGNPG
ncbi:hypothetical protein FCV25MIE_25939 [Fagus crenata]